MKRPIAMLLALLTVGLFVLASCGEEPVHTVQSSVPQFQSTESTEAPAPEPQSSRETLSSEAAEPPAESTEAPAPEPQSSQELLSSQAVESQHSVSENENPNGTAHTHQTGGYDSDFTYHWQVCADCGAEIENTRTAHDKTAESCICVGVHVHTYTDDCDAICDVKNCFYTRIPTHYLSEATCFAPKVCSKCRITYGTALGHTWSQDRCLVDDFCTRCGTEGYVMHNYEGGTCTRCNKPTSSVPHTLPR